MDIETNSAQFLVSPRVSLNFLIKKYIKIKILKMCSVEDIHQYSKRYVIRVLSEISSLKPFFVV